jgi:hypothetical protein
MKLLLLAGTAAFLGLAAPGSVARATLFDFTYSGSLVDFTVPTTDSYQILAFGAQGGSGAFMGFVSTGGQGAEIGGDFSLTRGEMLQIAVGGAGGDGSSSEDGGGGGGSFVVGPGNTPLVIAGGGGGGASLSFQPLPGRGGLTGPDGDPSILGGGTDGNGGRGFNGGGGGGFFSAGTDGLLPQLAGRGGGAFPGLAGGGGAAGGGDGGFGGGGGGGVSIHSGGGGGGGYSGGGGGFGSILGGGLGGGGGSFDAGTDQILVADFQTDNGEVVITELAAQVPEPGSLALLGVGLLSLAAIWRRRAGLSDLR